MAEVAAAASVSQGLAYRYFAGKDELFRALVEEAMLSGDWPHGTQGSGSPGEQLRTTVGNMLAVRRDRPEFIHLIEHVMRDPATPADLLERCRDRGRQFVTMVRRLVIEAQASGEVAPDDPDDLVFTLLACLEGLSHLSFRHPEARAHFPDVDVVMRIVEVRRPTC